MHDANACENYIAIILRWQSPCFQMYANTSVYCNTVALLLFICHKNAIEKPREICMETGSTSSATKVIAMYTRERGSPEANSGLSTSNLLLSYLILSMLSTYTFLSPHFTCTAPWHAWQIRQRSNLLRVRQDVTVGWTARARKPLHKADNDNVMCQNSASVALKTGVKCRTDKSLIQAHCGIFTCKTSYRKLRSKFWSSEIRLPS